MADCIECKFIILFGTYHSLQELSETIGHSIRRLDLKSTWDHQSSPPYFSRTTECSIFKKAEAIYKYGNVNLGLSSDNSHKPNPVTPAEALITQRGKIRTDTWWPKFLIHNMNFWFAEWVGDRATRNQLKAAEPSRVLERNKLNALGSHCREWIKFSTMHSEGRCLYIILGRSKILATEIIFCVL